MVPTPELAPFIPPVIVPTVHEKLPAALDVKMIFGDVPPQMVNAGALVTTGVGLTVTVIVETGPAQEPVIEVGVTLYCTVPASELLGLSSVWLIVPPAPPLAPVMAPVMIPTVHVKVLGALDVNPMLVPAPLQMLAVAAFVTKGVGLTVTVIVKVAPTHEPVTAVGVTMYSTVPAARLLGLVKTWLIVALGPPALAPVMPPVMVPMVHVNVLGVLAVKLMLGPLPLHAFAVSAFVIFGEGYTVTVIVKGIPVHEPAVEVGVTI